MKPLKEKPSLKQDTAEAFDDYFTDVILFRGTTILDKVLGVFSWLIILILCMIAMNIALVYIINTYNIN